MISAQEALVRLQQGNQRFVSGELDNTRSRSPARRAKLAAGQAPFAAILGCSDSRVPQELLFDQGLGDLFVMRVAGNIVTNSEVGSIEFAVNAFDTPLVVVLGHTDCGAVTSAVDPQTEGVPAALKSIVDQVRPAVEDVLENGGEDKNASFVNNAVRANVRRSVAQLGRESELLKARVEQGKLMIVGAKYRLDSGEVEFFDV